MAVQMGSTAIVHATVREILNHVDAHVIESLSYSHDEGSGWYSQV